MNPRTPRSERNAPLGDPMISLLAKSIRYAVRILAVLIVIEIFIKITSSLRDNVIHIKVVLATVFMDVARKGMATCHTSAGSPNRAQPALRPYRQPRQLDSCIESTQTKGQQPCAFSCR